MTKVVLITDEMADAFVGDLIDEDEIIGRVHDLYSEDPVKRCFAAMDLQSWLPTSRWSLSSFDSLVKVAEVVDEETLSPGGCND